MAIPKPHGDDWSATDPALPQGLQRLRGKGTPWSVWKRAPALANLARIEPRHLVTPGQRVVVVAPHPGFETLACGGLLQRLAQLDCSLTLISLTDGSGSHASSPRWTPERLSAIRPQESAESLRRLGLPINQLKWIRGGFVDGGLEAQQSELLEFLLRYLQPGDVVFTSWRQDGHPDHEATARAVAYITDFIGAQLYEIPVWAWHWAKPDDPMIPWPQLRKLPLNRWTLARKRHAVQAHASQLVGDPEVGLEAALGPHVQQRLLQPHEIFFATAALPA